MSHKNEYCLTIINQHFLCSLPRSVNSFLVTSNDLGENRRTTLITQSRTWRETQVLFSRSNFINIYKFEQKCRKRNHCWDQFLQTFLLVFKFSTILLKNLGSQKRYNIFKITCKDLVEHVVVNIFISRSEDHTRMNYFLLTVVFWSFFTAFRRFIIHGILSFSHVTNSNDDDNQANQ